MNFKDRFLELRKNNNLSQKELAEKLGFSQASIGYWEKGQRTPSIEAAQKIADYFNVSIAYLLHGDDSFYPSDIPAGMVIIGEGESAFDVNPVEFIEKFNNVAKQVHPSSVSNLLSDFFALNAKGQTEAVRQTKLLTKIPEYQKKSSEKETVKQVEELTEIKKYTE